MAIQIEFHNQKLNLNGNALIGNTFPIKDAIKHELGGRWNPAQKCWIVDIAKASAFAVAAPADAPAAAPASTPARPANWRMSDEITIGLAEEGRLAIEECPKGHRIYTVEVFEDTSFDSAWLICQTWVACPINVAPPPQNIVDGTQRQALAGMLVWAPGWVKPGKDAWSY